MIVPLLIVYTIAFSTNEVGLETSTVSMQDEHWLYKSSLQLHCLVASWMYVVKEGTGDGDIAKKCEHRVSGSGKLD